MTAICPLLDLAVSTTITQTFACETIDGQRFLRAELTLACDPSLATRRLWTSFAWIMLAAYPIGYPLLLLCLLVPQRGKIRELMVSHQSSTIQNTDSQA